MLRKAAGAGFVILVVDKNGAAARGAAGGHVSPAIAHHPTAREIESEIAGTIVEVTAENGKPVEYGDVLFRVKKA